METYKIITLGDTGVGKTSIIDRYTKGIFEEDMLSTIGVYFSFKDLTLEDGTKVKLKFIDTAGQEKYKSIAKSYYKNVQGVLFVFAFNNKNSFEHIEDWMECMKEKGEDNKDIPIFLVGNKNDVEKKEIDENLIEDLKNKMGIDNYIETSAKNNIGIEELFNKLAEIMYNKSKKYNGKKQKNIILEDSTQKEKDKNRRKKKKCCAPVYLKNSNSKK